MWVLDKIRSIHTSSILFYFNVLHVEAFEQFYNSLSAANFQPCGDKTMIDILFLLRNFKLKFNCNNSKKSKK